MCSPFSACARFISPSPPDGAIPFPASRLSAILIFIGVKMLIAKWYEIPVGWALGVVGGILLLAILASILWPKREKT